MALEPKTQYIPVQFGIDRSVDEEGNPKGFDDLVNCVFDKDGAVVPRAGLVFTTDLDAATRVVSQSSGSLGPDIPQCFVTSGDALGVALEQNCSAQARAIATLFPGQRIQQCEAACDARGLFTMFAFTTMTEDETTVFPSTIVTQPWLAVIENSTGQVVAINKLTTTAGSYYAKVVALYTGTASLSLWAVYYLKKNGANYDLTYLRPSFSTALTLGSETTITSSVTTIGVMSPFDVVGSSDFQTSYLIHTSAAATMRCEKRSYTGTVTSAIASGAFGAGLEYWIVRSTYPARDLCHVFFWQFSAGYKLYGITFDFQSGFVSALTTIQGTAATDGNPGLVAVAEYGTGGATINIAWNEGLNNNTQYLKFLSLTYAGANFSVGSLSTFNNALICSQAADFSVNHHGTSFTTFAVYQPDANATGYKNIVVFGITPSAEPPQALGQLTHEDGAPFKWDFTGPNYDFTRKAFFQPRWQPVATDTWRLPVLVTEANGPANQAGSTVDTAVEQGLIRRVRLVELAFRGARMPTQAAILGHQSFLAGSILSTWDGLRFAPAAFLTAPPAPSAAAGAAGSLTGVFSYRAVWEYTDMHGNISLSPPSAVATVTVTSKKVTVTAAMNTLWGPYVQTQGMSFRIRIYRTVAGGSDYYLLSSTVVDPDDYYGDSTVVLTDDLAASSTLLASTALYTGTSVISSMAPMISYAWAHRNRMFGIAADQPETIYFTTETTDPYRPTWNGALFIRVDNSGGAPVAGASLSDKILILQEDQLCVSGGEGPTALGVGNFTLPERFSAIGVPVSRRSTVVEARGAVFFTNLVSAYIVGPDLSVAAIGQPLGGREFWGTATFQRAKYLPSLDQLWLLGSGSTGTYVFDFGLSRWSQLSGPWVTLLDVAERLGAVYALPATVDGSGNYRVVKLDTTANYDTIPGTGASQYVTQTLGFPWFRPGANSADMRLWRGTVSARHASASPTTSPGITAATYVADERDSRASNAATTSFAWTGATIQTLARSFVLAYKAVTARCRAFRTVITVTPTATTDDRVVIAGLTYDYGIVGPSAKQPLAKRPSAS